MRKYRKIYLAVFLVGVLAGCQNISQGPAQDFVVATDALTQAESAYFDEIQAASDESHALRAAQYYVSHSQDWPVIAGKLGERDDFAKAKAVRLAMMAQLQNYARQIEAIATASSGGWITTDAKAAVTNTATLLNDAGGAKVTSQQSGLIQSAVGGLASAIVNAETARKLQSLAAEARAPINEIASVVAQDNDTFEADDYVANLATDQRAAMLNILNHVYADRGTNAGQRFDIIMTWGAWKPSVVTKGHDVNTAMTKLVAANEALAQARPFAAGALAQQAFAAAQHALGVPAAAN